MMYKSQETESCQETEERRAQKDDVQVSRDWRLSGDSSKKAPEGWCTSVRRLKIVRRQKKEGTRKMMYECQETEDCQETEERMHKKDYVQV